MYIVPLSGIAPVETVQTLGETAEPQKTSASMPFGDMLREAIENFSETQKAAEQDAYALVTGDTADLHSVMIRSTMQQASLEMTVQLASRAVSAYKEILQMQI